MINISDTLLDEDERQAQQYLKTVKRLMDGSTLSYWIGNPSVEIISGEMSLVPYLKPETCNSLKTYISQLKELNNLASSCLVIVGIPTSIGPLQVWESLAESKSVIKQCRVIKTEQPGYYGLMVRLKQEKQSQQKRFREFYDGNFGKRFNQIEEYLILFREVKDITLQFDEFVIADKTELQILRRKFTVEIQPIDPRNIFMTFTLSDKNSPTASFVCAICFEDMTQSSEAVLSILCGHYFHQKCLGQWTQNTCPLCRYHQRPPTLSFCQCCNLSDNLWMCLVCGRKLCIGQKQDLLSAQSHIYQHYKQTSHSIAMEIESKFVYQFSMNDFLHRVYFNQKTRSPEAGAQPKYKKKADVIKEYQHVARIQMEDQRKYFEKKLQEDKKRQRQSLQALVDEISLIKEQDSELDLDLDLESQQREVSQLENQLRTAEKYHTLMLGKVRSLDSQVSKVDVEQDAQIRSLTKQIMEKREQIRDIQQNVEANQKLKKKLLGQKISKEFFLKK